MGRISEAACQESDLYFLPIFWTLEENTSRSIRMPRRPKVDPETALKDQIAKLSVDLPAKLLKDLAKSAKFSLRKRKIEPALFFWNLILGFGASMQKTLAALKKRYCIIAAEDLVPSSFYERFNNRLVPYLQAILQHLLATTVRSEMPQKILGSFKDVLIFDSTIVRLLDTLASLFPGAGMPAGVKIATILSVATDNLYQMAFYKGKHADVKTLKLGKWIKNHLLLFDLGYFKYAVFEKIQRLGGHYITRLHGNANPKIISVNQTYRGRSINLVGKKIRDCLNLLDRGVIDAMVEVSVKRRPYRGKRSPVPLVMRLVGILNEETGEYHLYLTDLPVETFTPEHIAELYRGRWCVELLFKELKSRYALDVISTGNPEIVKALIYTAMILLVVSRKLFVGYRDAMARGGHLITKERWARFLVEYSGLVLREILKESKIKFTEETLLNMALHETVAPDPLRERLDDVWDM